MNTPRLLNVLAMTLLACTGCSQESEMPETGSSPAIADNPRQEAVSFGGKPLYRNAVDAERRKEFGGLIASAEAKQNLTEDDYITLGQYYIALNRFRDAIDLYTRGLKAHPESFKLRRHRGHRFINVRELDNAIVDLNEAVELMGDSSSEVLEFDASGKSTGTYEHWVWYHVGLYHYLNENYAGAVRAYEKCVATAINNKVLVGATDWLYNAHQKNADPEAAAKVIGAIAPDIGTDRNHPYFKRLMVYKGLMEPTEVLDVDKPVDEWTGVDITVGYGIANWYKFNGNEEVAEKIYRAILQTPYWNSWAYVVTDKENAT